MLSSRIACLGLAKTLQEVEVTLCHRNQPIALVAGLLKSRSKQLTLLRRL